MLRLTFLGGVHASRDHEPDVGLSGQQAKRLALLAYLAVARPHGAHRRDVLVALLWPDLDAGRARAALRQALHALRKSVGQELLVTAGTECVGLSTSWASCDVWDLEAAAERGDHARVAASYTGELLDGLFVSAAPAFEHWLDAERGRLRTLACDAAWKAGEGALVAGARAAVSRHVRIAVSLAGLDEEAIRRGMRMLADVGDRAAALALYERFALDLRRELEVEPAPDTAAVATDLREHARIRVTVPPLAASSAPPPPRDRTEPSQPARRPGLGTGFRAALALSGGLLAIALAASLEPSERAELDPRRVRIDAFGNETGIGTFDAVARTARADVRAAATSVDGVTVLAADADAGTRIRGGVRLVGDSIEVRADIVNVGSDAIVRSVATRTSVRYADAGSQFGTRVAAALASTLYPGWGSALSLPRSYDGHRLFVEGLRLIRLERHEAAIDAFRRAFAEDSAFATAGLLAAAELYNLGRFDAADSIATALTPRRAFLPAVDGHLLDWLARSLRADRIGARASMQSVVALAPDAELAWLQLAIDNLDTARPREALAALDQIERQTHPGDGWVALWAARADALHMIGDYDGELATIREALRSHPELRVLLTYELRALSALGRLTEVDRLLDLLAEQPPANGVDAPTTMRLAALELETHGHPDASRTALLRALAWYETRLAEDSSRIRRAGRARTLYLLDERAGARALYQAILAEHPSCLDCSGALGVLAARDGDGVTAARSADELAAMSRPFLFGRDRLWLARIDAALGDRRAAVAHLTGAFGAGAEFDVMMHVDPDLRSLAPDAVYRAFDRR